MAGVPPPGAVDELRRLAEERHVDPARVLEQARQLLAGDRDAAVRATVHWVIGLSLHELGRGKDAITSYRRSVAESSAAGLVDAEALARASLAYSLMTRGDAAGSQRAIAAARAVAPASVRGVVESLHAVCLARSGRLDEAMAAYQRALRFLEAVDDRPSIARLRLNRGILHAYQGRSDAALEDLAEAERLSVECGLPVLTAMAAHDTGFVHGRRGSVPEALAAFERVEHAYHALGRPARLSAVLEGDRCEVLLAAGLVAEARKAAEAAVAALESAGDVAHLSECRLLLARALLDEGAYKEAAAEADEAARRFRAQRRLPWAAQAGYVAVRAEVAACEDQQVPPPDLLRRSRRIAADLEARGWPVEALHVRTFVGRLALALDRPAVARAELAKAAGARTRGTAGLRARAWHATALLRLADGDEAAARRALTRGMAVVDEYRATLGATEMRASASGLDADLARTGLGLALRGGDAREVLRWAERRRAGALRRPPVRPPDDEELAGGLEELRRLRSALRDAALSGDPPRRLQRRLATVEKAVRDRTLKTRDEGGPGTGRLDVAALRRALGDRALVEFVAFEGRVHAVTVVGRRIRLFDLGPGDRVEQEVEYLLFGLRRLLARRSGPAAEDLVGLTAERLDDLLLAPLGLPAAAPVVVVPTGALHGLAWGALPTLAGRPATVAPSAAVWLARGRVSPAAVGGVALVAGPNLPAAEREVRAIAALHAEAEVLTGADATASAACAALEGSALAHVAAHGSFRADSPMFSSLLLADGPLTVYDLERLRRAPSVVVLPACHAAVSAVRTGDELLGTAAALIGLGVRSVIAPVMAVPDDATAVLMVDLHARLRAGDDPAAALAAAATGSDPVAARAFVCIGSDDRDVGPPAAARPPGHPAS